VLNARRVMPGVRLHEFGTSRKEMNYLRLLVVIVLAWYLSETGTMAQRSDNLPAQMLSKVGMMTRNFTDEKRKNWQGTEPRPLRTAVWYPAVATANKEETIFGGPPEKEVFARVTVAPGAEISSSSQKYPLVLMSHGTGGSAIQMMWLGYYLASRGYIVAAVNHHGNTAAERQPAPQGFLLYWERARDLTVVLDKLLADPVFGARIDRDRIGAAGFSLGGYTVISIAGGVFSPQEYESFCRSPQRDFTCGPQHEFPDAPRLFDELKKTDPVVQESLRHAGDSFKDKRIKRVFAISPALGSGFTKAGLSRIKVPVFIVIGQADKVTPRATNAQRYANLIKGARLTVLPEEIGHYTFLAECNPHGKAVVDICRDAEAVDRAVVHRQVAQLAFEFFEQGRVTK
jgi:predicted dienelactone hydrolase